MINLPGGPGGRQKPFQRVLALELSSCGGVKRNVPFGICLFPVIERSTKKHARTPKMMTKYVPPIPCKITTIFSVGVRAEELIMTEGSEVAYIMGTRP